VPGIWRNCRGVSDVAALPEQPVRPDRECKLLPQLFHQARISHSEPPLASLPGHGQHAIAALAVGQRNAQQRTGAQRQQQRDAILAVSQRGQILGMGKQRRAARPMDLARHRIRWRVHRRHHLGQLLRLLAFRPRHHLPPQPALPLHVHDDPGGQLAGEQPGALLQGNRLAVGDIFQQDPRGRGDQVEAADHVVRHVRGRLARLPPASTALGRPD